MSQLQTDLSEDWYGPVAPERTSERVAAAIHKIIVEGKLRPGDTLPPERTLAERFRVTRNTVREALQALQRSRLLSIRQGSGARVLDYLGNAGLEFASTLLGLEGASQRELVADLVEARDVVGQAIFLHAVDRFDRSALQEVQRAVGALVAEAERDRPDARRLQELELDVQHWLLRGGGNRTILLLHNSIRHVYARVTHLFEPLVESPATLASQYQRVLRGLASGDRGAARRAMRAILAMQRSAMERSTAATRQASTARRKRRSRL